MRHPGQTMQMDADKFCSGLEVNHETSQAGKFKENGHCLEFTPEIPNGLLKLN